MKAPSAANKRCLLHIFANDTLPESPRDWTVKLASFHAIIDPLCQWTDSSSSAGRAPPPAVGAWATLLADQVKRAKAHLDDALSATGAPATDHIQQLLELSWLQLDALHAVRRGWKSDSHLAVQNLTHTAPVVP